jgi:HEPN domain-containing protein
MRSKPDHINFWIKSAETNWEAGEVLLKNKKHVEGLFMFCLAIEKFLKANWVNDNIDNTPPRIHELQAIYAETDLDLDTDLIDFMDTVNRWNIEGRYPDYKFSLYKIANDDYIEKQMLKLNLLKSCLLEGL